MVRRRLLDQKGVFHLPLALVLCLSLIAALGCLGFLRRWHHLADLQLRLDQCVGKTASELRSKLKSLDSDNHRIQVLRISAALAPEPHVREALKAALKAVVLHQEITRVRWNAERAKWLVSRGCSGRDVAVPLPSLPWHRPPPDSLGPKPLAWPKEVQKSLWIRLAHRPRYAAARVYFEERKSHEWKMEWKPFGPGLR